MPWYFPWSDALNKRACRYLLQRYLGQFLQEKLSLDQLSVNLYSGTGKINDVYLDVEALNEAGEKYQLPIEIVDGFIKSISVSIPWASLLSESSVVEVHGLGLTLQPKPRSQSVSSAGSLWGSMVSSLQLAEEFMKERTSEDEKEIDAGQPFEALELFAQTIDTVFRRIKVTFTDTVIRLEQSIKPGNTGTALEIRIKRLEYYDEAGIEETSLPEEISQDHVYHPVAFATKKFRLEGVSLYTDEYCSKSQMWRSQCSSDPKTPNMSGDLSPRIIDNDSSSSSVKDDSKPASDEESEEISNLVLITKLVDHQEVRLKLKQDDNIPGPQAEVEFNFGPFPIFLCPRQIHLLFDIFNSLHSPTTTQRYRKQSANKPMGVADFTLVEQELQKHLTQPTVFNQRSLQQPQGWSTHSLDDSEEDFQPARGTSTMFASKTSASCDLDSSFESKDLNSSGGSLGKPSSLYSRSTRTKVQELLDDSSTGEVRFRLSCSSLCLVILHEDLRLPSKASPKTSQVILESKPNSVSEKFFDELAALLDTGDSLKDFIEMKSKITNICGTNHIRLMAAPLVIEGNRKSMATGSVFSISLTIADVELFECLMDELNGSSSGETIVPTYTELLKFSGALPYSKDSSLPYCNEPSLRLKYVQKSNTTQTFREHPSTLSLQLGPFQSEVDITIADRLHYLIKPQTNSSKWDPTQSAFNPKLLDEDRNLTTDRTDISLSSPFVELNIRFPVPDLRPVHSLERVPWWKKNLREETLVIEMTEVTLSNVWSNDEKESKYELQCKDAHGLLQMSPSEPAISFARISVDPRADKNSTEHGFDWPRLVLKITQAKTPSVLETNALEDDLDDLHMATSTTHSMYLHQMNPSPLSPFASRKIVYDRSSPEGNKFSSVGDTDQVVMPADKERMSEFIEKSMLNCKMTFDISLPTLNLILPSKNFYEIIYNRISNDLALWEPAAPKPVCSSESVYFDGYQVKRNLLKESSYFEAFSVCKSGAQYDSSSDSEDGGGGGNYYSVMAPNTHHVFKPSRKIFPSYVQAQSKLAINVSIGQGILNFCTKAEENDSEEYQGEFQINVEDGSFFFVSYYNGDPNLAYSCLNVNQGVLFHNGCVLKSPLKKLKPAVLYSPAHLNKTLYRSDPSVLPPNSTQCSSERLDLLSLVIRTGIEPNQGLKTFKVAVGLQEATLRHRMSVMPQSWLSQFINFFDVSNHPVVGYVPPPIVTELHLHLNTCAVDYRPLYLPLRALATVENFSISSNLAAQATTSLLRIISEELLIYISNKTDTEMVDLKNYVCVLDTGLFDVSLRMSDGKDSNQPVHDLRATNNCVHIHTCADSCKALQDLITYFASDGDLLNTSDTFFDASDEPYSLVYNGLYDNEPDTLVHRLMEDAMQESLDNISESSIEVEESEECKEAETLINETNPYLAANNDSAHNASHSSDEFCILEEDLGSGIIPPSGEPQVRLLSHEQFNVIENHFAKPIGRSDQLKPPPHYPKPIRKYSLREMSLVWHLYGGCDFQTPEVKPEKEKVQKRTRIVSGDNDDWSLNNHSLSSSPKHKVTLNLKSQGSDFKKISPHESIWTNINSVQKECSSPETRCRSPQPGMGGIGRSHDVVVELQMNKMRFQYDLYPENGEYDSRQVLLIQDIEIRDRLASSEINKFLYQFSSEALPRQTHANMLLIKAVHVRPDPSIPKSECSLRVSLKPLRLNIDQDTLLFLCGFFSKLYGPDTNLDQLDENIPIQTNIGPDSDPILQSNYVRNEPLSNSTLTDLSDASSCSRSSPPVYFRSFVFSPDVPIQLDYHGKRVDMEQGALAGLLMGLGQLNKSKIILRRVTFRHGLLGLDRLLAYVINEWLQDIKKNQLPSLLGGLGPMYSFVQLFQGVRDLIWLPIEQYRKDGRIMRGIQRGANSFTTSTAMAFLELTNRMVLIIQGAAEFAYDMVSPGPSVKSRSHTVQKKWHLSSEPLDIREGVAYAYHVVREGIGDTARTIVRVASEEHDHKGMPGAVGGVLRQIPPIMVKPIILATEATSNVLGGVRNQLVPDARRDAVEKWRGRTAH